MSVAAAPEHARIDSGGLLVEADERLLALNTQAGGAVGTPLAVPALSALVSLVRTMRVPISRTVFAADGAADLELYVQAKPDSDGISLTVSGWRIRPARKSWLVEQPDGDETAPSEGWSWQTDAALVLTEISLAAGDTTELRSADVIGKPLTRLVRLIEDDDGDLPILAALASGTAFDDQRAVRRDQPDAELKLSGQPVRDANGNFLGFSGVASPTQRAKQSTEQSPDNDFTEQLGQAIRGPLDRIIARADSIGAQTDGPLRRDYADYAGDIASAGRHLLALVDDLQDLQAVERADFAVPGEPIDLADITRRAAGLLRVWAADKQVRIDRPDADETLMARGDFRRALQILVNLLTNAVRYSPPGAMIWIRTEVDGDSAVVVVADQGKGIDPADHERVFQKFERVDTSELGGSGLGLYISRRLARAMGGDITLDSAPGQGARFVLTLPVA